MVNNNKRRRTTTTTTTEQPTVIEDELTSSSSSLSSSASSVLPPQSEVKDGAATATSAEPEKKRQRIECCEVCETCRASIEKTYEETRTLREKAQNKIKTFYKRVTEKLVEDSHLDDDAFDKQKVCILDTDLERGEYIVEYGVDDEGVDPIYLRIWRRRDVRDHKRVRTTYSGRLFSVNFEKYSFPKNKEQHVKNDERLLSVYNSLKDLYTVE